MKHEHEAKLERAQRRVEWSVHALRAAADDLLAAGEHGALVKGTASKLRNASSDTAELVAQIVADRKRSDSDHRLRDAL
jgi:hypothetical protein